VYVCGCFMCGVSTNGEGGVGVLCENGEGVCVCV
jgi:hypothetical protein